MPALPINTDQIVITASRAPEERIRRRRRASPSSTSIEIERLGEPLAAALLRLDASAAVATSGPAGSLTEVRIRGSEANHTLLFIDGIRIDDPAAGDTARFEMLNADLASRIEVVRGPQSAIWGSEAIGGVIAVNGLDEAPGYSAPPRRVLRLPASERLGCSHDRACRTCRSAIGWQRGTGIDSFGAPGGDRDGYRNFSGRLRGTVSIGSGIATRRGGASR